MFQNKMICCIHHFYFRKENQYSSICSRDAAKQTLQLSVQLLSLHFLIDVAVMDDRYCQIMPVIAAGNLKYIPGTHILHHLPCGCRGHDDEDRKSTRLNSS